MAESAIQTKRTLLWINPSPTSSFAAQVISLDLSNFDEVEIVTKHNADTTNQAVMQKFAISDGGGVITSFQMNDTWYMRRVTLSSSGVTFAEGRYCYMANGQNGALNGTCIPVRIYGLRGGV